jgi:hypothetical protein
VITSGQGSVGATAVRLCAIPPGPACLQVSNLGTASPVYVGPGTNVSSTNGFPVPSGVLPVVLPLYAGSAAGTLYAVTASGSANVGWIVTSPTGGTGTGTLG